MHSETYNHAHEIFETVMSLLSGGIRGKRSCSWCCGLLWQPFKYLLLYQKTKFEVKSLLYPAAPLISPFYSLLVEDTILMAVSGKL